MQKVTGTDDYKGEQQQPIKKATPQIPKREATEAVDDGQELVEEQDGEELAGEFQRGEEIANEELEEEEHEQLGDADQDLVEYGASFYPAFEFGEEEFETFDENFDKSEDFLKGIEFKAEEFTDDNINAENLNKLLADHIQMKSNVEFLTAQINTLANFSGELLVTTLFYITCVINISI